MKRKRFKFNWNPYVRFLLLLLSNFIILFNLIEANQIKDFRCTHVPSSSDQPNHVWLDEGVFNTSSLELHSEDILLSSRSQEVSNSSFRTKNKRHIEDERGQLNLQHYHSTRGVIKDNEEQQSDIEPLIPIKIKIHYDSSVYQLSEEKKELIIDTVMPSVVKFFEGVLSIRRDFTIDRFRIARRCPNNTVYYARDNVGLSRPFCLDRCEDYAVCGEMLVPQVHLSACSYCNSTSRRCNTDHGSEGEGVPDTQLLLYVSAKQTGRCKMDQTIAYAAHCAQDSKTDRPVAGHANLCPSSISADAKDLKALIATVKHELTHVLGFSVSLFAYYRDENGRPLTKRHSNPGPIPIDPKTGYARWSDKIIRRYIRTDWLTGEGSIEKEVHLLVTPTVVREVRNHFNCSTLEGAELEDQGSDGTSMTHWEKRLFENEAMTGTHTQNSVYSRLTLAALQDTGWYVANFSRADKLEWGKNLGCNFAKKSCKSWIDERREKGLSIRPFCDKVKGDFLEIFCTEDRESKAVCNMKFYKEPLPKSYQNFDQLEGVTKDSLAHYGGSVDLADYCPFIQEFTWQAQNVTARGSRCDISSNNLEHERNAALEFYGAQTKCFEHGHRWEQKSCAYRRHWHHYGAGCYTFECANGHLSVIVGNYSYPCYYAGQLIHIQQLIDQWFYNGTLICPPCEKVCKQGNCEYYDRRVIVDILNLDEEWLIGETNTDTRLASYIDENLNSIETSQEIYKSLAKMGKQIAKADLVYNNKSRSRSLLMHKENIIQIMIQRKKSPNHSLYCSRASQDNPNNMYILLLVKCLLAHIAINYVKVQISSS